MQVSVEGIRLHVEAFGDGPPLLLINGIGAHAGMWQPLREALPGPRLIAFDAPGTGRSATPPIHDLVCDGDRGEAVEVTKAMLVAELRATDEAHPLALMSAGVRAFWS